MTETVVRVETLEQWKSVLDIWFKQGYSWYRGGQKHHKTYFNGGGRELLLDEDNDILRPTPGKREPISYKDFMAQQKDDNKMVTVYVKQEQLDLIEELKYETYPAYELLKPGSKYRPITLTLDSYGEKALLRYIGGDETIKFKVKEPLYRLWRMETNDRIYMRINDFGTPIWTVHKDNAFTAPLEEIKKWQTPAWEIEDVD